MSLVERLQSGEWFLTDLYGFWFALQSLRGCYLGRMKIADKLGQACFTVSDFLAVQKYFCMTFSRKLFYIDWLSRFNYLKFAHVVLKLASVLWGINAFIGTLSKYACRDGYGNQKSVFILKPWKLKTLSNKSHSMKERSIWHLKTSCNIV